MPRLHGLSFMLKHHLRDPYAATLLLITGSAILFDQISLHQFYAVLGIKKIFIAEALIFAVGSLIAISWRTSGRSFSGKFVIVCLAIMAFLFARWMIIGGGCLITGECIY